MVVTFTVRVPAVLKREIAALRRLYIMEAMRVAEGCQSDAASLLGMNRNAFEIHLRKAELYTAQVRDIAVARGELGQ